MLRTRRPQLFRFCILVFLVSLCALTASFAKAEKKEIAKEANPYRKITEVKKACADLLSEFKIDPWERDCVEKCDASDYTSIDPTDKATIPSGEFKWHAWRNCVGFDFQCRVLCHGYFVNKRCFDWFKDSGLKPDPNSMECPAQCKELGDKYIEPIFRSYFSKLTPEEAKAYLENNNSNPCDSSPGCEYMCADNAHTIPAECYRWFSPIWNSLPKKDLDSLPDSCINKCKGTQNPAEVNYCSSYCDDLCSEFIYPLLQDSTFSNGIDSKTEELPKFKDNADNKKETICDDILKPGFFRTLKFWPKNPINFAIAYFSGKEARKRAEKLFPPAIKDGQSCSSLHNGKGDAFRHCYWSCRMTYLFENSPDLSMDYSSWYEYTNPGPCEEALMDYQNNKTGTEIAASGGDCIVDCQKNENLKIIGDPVCN
jgi:hypothetical protein